MGSTRMKHAARGCELGRRERLGRDKDGTRRGKAERRGVSTSASSFGRFEVWGRVQAAPGCSLPPCEAPRGLFDCGEVTVEEIDKGGAARVCDGGSTNARGWLGFGDGARVVAATFK
jgi:hypothetical protein